MTTKTHCIHHNFLEGRCFHCNITKQAHKAIQKQKVKLKNQIARQLKASK